MDNAANIRYPSLTALQAAHNGLLKRQRREADASAFLSQVTAFLSEGAATGALLDADADRRAAQGLLDYWVARLYRVGAEPPDATLAEFDPAVAPELPDNLCPYLGLDAFRETDSDKFFGRAELIARLVERLANQRLLAVVGPSGSGKSSLVRAGLVPVLKHDALPGSKDWSYLPPIVPGSDPLAALQRVLSDKQTSRQADDVYAQPSLPVSSSLNLLVIDQFEELFTLCDDDQARQAFVAALREWIDTPEAENRLILTMRSDFETFVARAPDLQARFNQGRVQVTPLSAAELREAIEHPAEAAGLKFQAGIVEALLQDILGEPAGLPLLQFTLLKLWEHRDHNRVTREIYDHVGGGRLALARCADEFYDSLIPEERVTARRILLRMIRPGEGLEITSSRIRREDLYRSGEDPGRIDRVLAKLIDTRLVRLTEGKTREDTQVEVAHEALVRNWPTLVDWLEQEKAALAIRRRLEGRAIEWVRLGQGSGGLLDEVELREAERWLASTEAQYLGYDTALPALVEQSRATIAQAEREKEAIREAAHQRELEIQQSRVLIAEAERTAAEQRMATNQRELEQANALASEQRRSQSRLRVILIVTAVGLVGALVAATLAVKTQQQEAQSRRAVQTAAAAAEINNKNTQAQATRAAVFQNSLVVANATEVQNRKAAQEQLQQVKGQLATRVADSNLRETAIANLNTNLQQTLTAQEAQLHATLVAVPTPQTNNLVEQVQGLVTNGNYKRALELAVQVATTNQDSQQRDALYIATQRYLESTGRLIHHGTSGVKFDWGAGSRYVATISTAEKAPKVWDTQTFAEVPGDFGGGGEILSSIAWSSDSTRIATTALNGTVRIWDVEQHRVLFRLAQSGRQALSVAWRPDDAQIVVTYNDGITIWSTVTGQMIGSIATSATELVERGAWSLQNELIAYDKPTSDSQQGTAHIYTNQLTIESDIMQSSPITSAMWHSDRATIVTGGQDGTVHLWEPDSGTEVCQLSLGAEVVATSRSPDGNQILAVVKSGAITVWQARDNKGRILCTKQKSNLPVVAKIPAFGDAAYALWSGDGQHIAVAYEDGTLRLFNVSFEDLLRQAQSLLNS